MVIANFGIMGAPLKGPWVSACGLRQSVGARGWCRVLHTKRAQVAPEVNRMPTPGAREQRGALLGRAWISCWHVSGTLLFRGHRGERTP